jgi:hypothetical protein
MVLLSVPYDLPHEFRHLVLIEIFGFTSFWIPLNRQRQPENSLYMELLAWPLAWRAGGISYHQHWFASNGPIVEPASSITDVKSTIHDIYGR